jgi:hypothetical protein
MAITAVFSIHAPQAKESNEEIIKKETKEMLSGYRGAKNIPIAIVDNDKTPLSNQITNIVYKMVFNDGRFIIVEREMLDRIMKEMSLQQTGLMDSEIALRVGKLTGAKVILFIKKNSNYILRMVSVESGQVLAYNYIPVSDSGLASENKDKAIDDYESSGARDLKEKHGGDSAFRQVFEAEKMPGRERYDIINAYGVTAVTPKENINDHFLYGPYVRLQNEGSYKLTLYMMFNFPGKSYTFDVVSGVARKKEKVHGQMVLDSDKYTLRKWVAILMIVEYGGEGDLEFRLHSRYPVKHECYVDKFIIEKIGR